MILSNKPFSKIKTFRSSFLIASTFLLSFTAQASFSGELDENSLHTVLRSTNSTNLNQIVLDHLVTNSTAYMLTGAGIIGSAVTTALFTCIKCPVLIDCSDCCPEPWKPFGKKMKKNKSKNYKKAKDSDDESSNERDNDIATEFGEVSTISSSSKLSSGREEEVRIYTPSASYGSTDEGNITFGPLSMQKN